MEEKIRFLWEHFLWAAVIVPIVMSTTATNNTTSLPPQTTEGFIHDAYAWTSWSNWSPCSKSCGGGVSVQERQCLPRIIQAPLSGVNGTLPPPVITVRVTRQTHQEDCLGVSKRYHQCNNSPCPGGISSSSRAEQCAAFDRRPFRGRFYTWVPYIDGDAPCTLNCRPLGQHFYASLSLVADGTPCTRPGLNAICIQGACKVIGRETVLAGSGTREMRCGRRLVSGLFSRPRLELGYSYVTTVPRGACRLNISEIVPSENYIALKISNSSYIMNGEFAVSAPGSYDAAGARFFYTRVAGLDSVFALGPIHHPIDIMILYTQPKPSIKYEYFTESLSGESEVEKATRIELHDAPFTSTTKHVRRHHGLEPYPRPSVSTSPDLVSMSKENGSAEDKFVENVVGSRKFIWKIMSYTQCTRSCGGGIQLGKYRCIESSSNGPDREVSAVHCVGSPPIGRRRRCGNIQCPPRWRATNWSPCPKCGPATRSRIVGCVQDHSKGITKISDLKCPPPKLANIEKCNIPNCDELISGIGVKQVEARRVIKPREHTETFREGPTYTLSTNDTEFDLGPEYSFSAAAGWLFTEWTECIGWCVGGGIQTRAVRCTDPSGCGPRKSPESSRECNAKLPCEPLEGQWFTGEWSRCSSECGGKQVRGVLCIGGTGRHLRDSACHEPRPDRERSCGPECPPTWYFSDWGQCIGNCTSDMTSSPGEQRRSVVCAGSTAVGEAECAASRPLASRPCHASCNNPSTLPPEFVVESQVASTYDTSSTQKSYTTKVNESKDCEDKLHNCALAVQARLCHYKYYIQNCCNSCYGR